MLATRASRELHRPFVHPPTTEVVYRRWLEQARREGHQRFLLWRSTDGALLGYFSIFNIVLGTMRGANIGYWANAEYAGCGYMRSGFELLLVHAFHRLRLHRLEANVRIDNPASRKLIRRVGFRREGIARALLREGGQWHDHERWALTLEEFRARRGSAAPGTSN